MGGGPDFVNIVTGRDISWLVTLSNFAGTINVSGGQPFVISGNQIATLDPTLFATFDRALMDFSRGVSSAIPMFEGFSNMPGGTAIAFAAPQSPAARVEDVFASIPGLSAYAADPMAFKKPEVVLADGAALWARGFGGERIQPSDGILFKATSEYYGGMMGGDWLVRPELRLGAFIGGGATRTSLDQNAGWANSDLVFGGGFARMHSASFSSSCSAGRAVAEKHEPHDREQSCSQFADRDGELRRLVHQPGNDLRATPCSRQL